LGSSSDARGRGPWPDPRGLRFGSEFGPKGWGPWPDPRELRFGSVSGPKWAGFVPRPKGVRGLGPCPDSSGLGFRSFQVRTQEGWVRVLIQGG